MLTWDNFKCTSPYFTPHQIENHGDYGEIWCGHKGKYILNCDGCPYNEKEKEMRADPNNYQEWLRRHKNERT